MTTLIKYINNRIDEDLDSVNFSKENFDRIEYLLKNNNKLSIQFQAFIDSILKVSIKNNKVIFLYEQNDILGRKTAVKQLIQKSIEHIISKGKSIPDVTLYIGTKDSHNYYEPELPIFVLAKPINEPGILIPDNTFDDWDKDREEIKTNCKKVIKESKVFFRGANTGARDHNLRKLLEKDRKIKIPTYIKISKAKVPQYTFCKYKYLLNLPGVGAWSYRFKYLFFMKSLVINVALHYDYGKKYKLQSKWIQFFDNYFIPGEDYIEIDYHWGSQFSEKDKRKNYKELTNKLEKIYKYYENNPDKYNDMVKSGNTKIKKITQEVVYDSVYKLIKKYSKKI
jgi:hypothetical protein